MAATDPKYVIRYPEELRQRVAASAKANGRTINAEICFQLQRAYAPSVDAAWYFQRIRDVTTQGDVDEAFALADLAWRATTPKPDSMHPDSILARHIRGESFDENDPF